MSKLEKKEEKAEKPLKKVPAAKPMRRAAMPMKEMPKEPSPRTVKGKIEAIQKFAPRIYAGARAIQSSVREQTKENQEAVADLQSGIAVQMKENMKAVAAMQSGINEQINENKVAVATIQSSVEEQVNENNAYVKSFYG